MPDEADTTSQYRYEVQYEAPPIMTKGRGGKTTLTEMVYCDEFDVVVVDDVPSFVEFTDEKGKVFVVHYDKFVSAERVSKGDER